MRFCKKCQRGRPIAAWGAGGWCKECINENNRAKRQRARDEQAVAVPQSMIDQLEVQRVWRPTTTK